MTKKENPFTVIFGVEPQSMIPRRAEEETVISVFESEVPSTYAYAIVGVRGCGKTVLLTSLQKYFSGKKGWIVCRLNSDLDFYESAVSQLSEHIDLPKDITAEINMQVAKVGVILSKRSLLDKETLLRRLLSIAQKKKKRVLFAIDEATNTNSFKAFAHSYQAFIGEGLPVFLLLTLLPENLESLSSSVNSTFLRRLPRVVLSELSNHRISNEYARIFEVPGEDADKLAKVVRGYSYAYQLLGYLLWKNGLVAPSDRIMEEFDEILDECVYTPVWNSIPEKEKSVLYAMAQSEDDSVKSIRDILDMRSNEFSPYRERLAVRGLINTKIYGRISFRLPRFKEFVLRKMRFEMI